MFENERIPVYLACNDPDNGAFAEQLWALKVGENMSFECRYADWAPRLRYIVNPNPGTKLVCGIVIAGKRFPVEGHRPWHGNWCWDAVAMRGADVLTLLNWPRLRKWFDVEEGETRLFNWWKAGQTWTDSDLRLIGKRF